MCQVLLTHYLHQIKTDYHEIPYNRSSNIYMLLQ